MDRTENEFINFLETAIETLGEEETLRLINKTRLVYPTPSKATHKTAEEELLNKWIGWILKRINPNTSKYDVSYIGLGMLEFAKEYAQSQQVIPKEEWISVKDGLPKLHTLVLVLRVYGSGNAEYRLSYINHHGVFDDFQEDLITHWMPLPKPPTTNKP